MFFIKMHYSIVIDILSDLELEHPLLLFYWMKRRHLGGPQFNIIYLGKSVKNNVIS